MDTYLRCQCVSVVGFFNYIVRAAAPTPECFSLVLFYFYLFIFYIRNLWVR